MALFLFLLIAIAVAAILVAWAAYGGLLGRWVVVLLLVGWVCWAAERVIARMFPHVLYSVKERDYMEKLGAAISSGREQVPLAELTPFTWSEMCFVSTPYHKLGEKDRQDVLRVTGVDAGRWFEEKKPPTMLFKTPRGVVWVRDFSKSFWKIERVEKVPSHASYYAERGYYVYLGMGADEVFVFCGRRGEVYVTIQKI